MIFIAWIVINIAALLFIDEDKVQRELFAFFIAWNLYCIGYITFHTWPAAIGG